MLLDVNDVVDYKLFLGEFKKTIFRLPSTDFLHKFSILHFKSLVSSYLYICVWNKIKKLCFFHIFGYYVMLAVSHFATGGNLVRWG